MDVSADVARPARLTGFVSWLITQTAAHASRLVSDGMAAVGARGYHYRLLLTLEEFGPGSQAALSRHSGIHVSDLVATVNELAEQGLVERSPDPVDRRRNVITITEAGRQRLRALDREIVKVQEDLLEPLSATEREELRRLLTLVLEHQTRSAAGEARRSAPGV